MLWLGLFLVLLAAAGVEGMVFWIRGFRYTPRSALQRVCPADISLDAKGEWAVGRVVFMGAAIEKGLWSDVVLLDLRNQNAIPLGVRRLKPLAAALAPNARSIAIGCEDGSIYSMKNPFRANATPGATHERLPRRVSPSSSSDSNFARLVFSPNSRLLAAIDETEIFVWRWPSGVLVRRRAHSRGAIKALTFSPDSKNLIFPGEAGGLRVWNLRTGRDVETVAKNQQAIFDAAMFPNGQLVATATSGYTRVSIHRVGDSGALWSQPSSYPTVALDPQGGKIAIVVEERGAYGINIYEAESGRKLCRLPGDDALITGMAFATTGELYSWDLHGMVHAWDFDNKKKTWSLSLFELTSHRHWNSSE